MKIAIIGAGISGLSCAHEFKKNGIIPTIFEKKGCIGEILDFQSAILHNLDFPSFRKPFDMLRKAYNIDIKPQYAIKERIAYSPNKKIYIAKGNLGYVLKRGMVPDSIENQIAQAVNIPIQFNTTVNPKDIINDFDYVIVASANYEDPQSFNLFTKLFQAEVRIATIYGSFKTDSINSWWNMDYCNNGYAYLIPCSPYEARIILATSGISSNELNYYWNKFIIEENIKYEIASTRDIKHVIGSLKRIQLGNMYFIGTAGGFIDDLLGFAAVNSIVSGVTAARAIINKKNYEKMMYPYKQDLRKKHEFRTGMNTLDNNGRSRTLALAHFPVIKQLVFIFPLFKFVQITFIAKIYNYFWRKVTV